MKIKNAKLKLKRRMKARGAQPGTAAPVARRGLFAATPGFEQEATERTEILSPLRCLGWLLLNPDFAAGERDQDYDQD
jgi:hypothetical protein